jgi:hypothetical protein
MNATPTASTSRYRATESKNKDGAAEMYVTYDLKEKTRGETSAEYPKVKRVYIAGKVKHWKAGLITKRSGRRVHGVSVEYEQTRRGYHRKAYAVKRGKTSYKVAPATVKATAQNFTKVVEIPKAARNVHFYLTTNSLPKKYRSALQTVR